MKTLFRYLTLIVATIVLVIPPSCGEKTPEDNTPPQTLIFYFTGTQLSFYFYRNISAIKDAVRGDVLGRSRILYLFQNSDKSKAELIELTYAEGLCTENILATYNLPAIMDEQNLSYIMKDITRIAPAKHYGLVMAGHSTAWIPINTATESGTRIMSTKPTDGFDHEAFWQKQKGEYDTRYFGEKYNSSSANRFDISTLSRALSSTGVYFDYILFDACFMANIESMYDLRDNARYLIGSPCEIMGDGFPYAEVVPQLMLNGGRDYDLDAVCKAFNQHYATTKGFSGSVALIDTSQLGALASAMKKVNAAAVKDGFDPDEVQTYEGHSRHIFFDLGDYVDKMCADASVASAFRQQLNRTVVSKYTLDKFYSNYGVVSGQYSIDTNVYSGLTTSAPSEVYTEDWKQTAWYKATH